MINSSLFFLRQCESLDWSDCFVVFLLSATHFRKSGHARLIRGCFSFSQCFRASVFYSLSLPPTHSLRLAPFSPLFGKFQHGAFVRKNICAPEEKACTAGYIAHWNFFKFILSLKQPWMKKEIAKKHSSDMCTVSKEIRIHVQPHNFS